MRDYDLAQADKLSIGLITEAVITLYLDLIAKMSYMLLIIPLSGITGKINNPLVQVHFFKKKAVGALARPFKSAFEAAMARSQQQVEEVKDEEGGEEPNIPALAEEVVEVVDAVEKVVDEEEEEEEALASGEREEGEEDSEVVGDPEEESLESTTEESVEEPAPAAELTESWPSLSDMAADTDISAGYSGEEEYLQEEQPYDETTHYDGSNSGEVEVDYDHEFSASEFSEIEDGGEQEIGQDEH